MLPLEDIGPDTPRLPGGPFRLWNPVAASVMLHAVMGLMMVAITRFTVNPTFEMRSTQSIHDQGCVDLQHIVFLSRDVPRVHDGGGGGGNGQRGRIRHAEGIGQDTITLRVKKSASASGAGQTIPTLPAVLVDAAPLASGTVIQIGLPTGGVSFGTSTGAGSGGGVGTGVGTGIGPGSGAGIGPGSGGGIGGGVYRPGGSVTAPRVIAEVKPKYTNEALLRRIQGTVVLELVVTREGRASQIQVVQSLDPEGLDHQAVEAVAEWRFEPGRLAGTPVDVLVTVMLDFRIR